MIDKSEDKSLTILKIRRICPKSNRKPKKDINEAVVDQKIIPRRKLQEEFSENNNPGKIIYQMLSRWISYILAACIVLDETPHGLVYKRGRSRCMGNKRLGRRLVMAMLQEEVSQMQQDAKASSTRLDEQVVALRVLSLMGSLLFGTSVSTLDRQRWGGCNPTLDVHRALKMVKVIERNLSPADVLSAMGAGWIGGYACPTRLSPKAPTLLPRVRECLRAEGL